jgi:hypothetical protein
MPPSQKMHAPLIAGQQEISTAWIVVQISLPLVSLFALSNT